MVLIWFQATPKLSEDKVKQCVDPKLRSDYPAKAVAKVQIECSMSLSVNRLSLRVLELHMVQFTSSVGIERILTTSSCDEGDVYTLWVTLTGLCSFLSLFWLARIDTTVFL